jgi:uncharacterized RDD family membrane protein YckC
MSRKTTFASEPVPVQEGRLSQRSRAAQAAARVAARYAKAPRYNEFLADEARNAMRAVEAASEAAQQAHAAVQCVLDGLEAADAPELLPQQELGASDMPASHEARNSQPLDERSPFSAANRAQQSRRTEEPGHMESADNLLNQAPTGALAETVEDDPGEPIYPNLIQFPRPMVATRRMRPRRAEGPLAGENTQPQLSIFEVDPGSVSIEATTAVDEPAAPVWMRAEELSPQFEPQPREPLLEEAVPQATRRSIKLAPLNLRLMSIVVDSSLILAACLALARMFVTGGAHLRSLHTAEILSAIALVAVGAAYQALFVILTGATPGMRYAGVALSTFKGQLPSRSQRRTRLAALVLSVLPFGLGLVWAVFDEDGLMGHERFSKTYLRKL